VAPAASPGGVGCPANTDADSRALSDREALVALYNGTGGPNWHSNGNWLTEEPLDRWHGITTDHAGRVKSLSLEENNLEGAIPPEP